MCSNKEEWENFPNRFKDSTNSKERKFYKYLTRNLIPLILRDLKSFEGLIIERDRKIMELEEAKRDRVLQQQQYEEELANLKLAREREKELAEEAKKKPKIEAPPKRTSSRIKEKVVYVNSDIRVESGDGDYAGSRLISRRSTGAYQTRLSLNL